MTERDRLTQIQFKNESWIQMDSNMRLRGFRPTQAEYDRRNDWTPENNLPRAEDEYEQIPR